MTTCTFVLLLAMSQFAQITRANYAFLSPIPRDCPFRAASSWSAKRTSSGSASKRTRRAQSPSGACPLGPIACGVGVIAASYGSGLPFEFTGDRAQAVAQYGERIVERVDLEAGRVGPSLSLDASV